MLGYLRKRQQLTKEQTLSQETKIKLHQSFPTHNKSQENMRKKVIRSTMRNATFSIVPSNK